MDINITLRKELKIPQQMVDAFESELNCTVKNKFPDFYVTLKKVDG